MQRRYVPMWRLAPLALCTPLRSCCDLHGTPWWCEACRSDANNSAIASEFCSAIEEELQEAQPTRVVIDLVFVVPARCTVGGCVRANSVHAWPEVLGPCVWLLMPAAIVWAMHVAWHDTLALNELNAFNVTHDKKVLEVTDAVEHHLNMQWHLMYTLKPMHCTVQTKFKISTAVFRENYVLS